MSDQRIRVFIDVHTVVLCWYLLVVAIYRVTIGGWWRGAFTR
jgi:hypothetical protein